MKLFQLLAAVGGPVTPKTSKVHWAVHNKIEDPLDEYLEGNFDRWQAEQSQRNFEREHVISFVRLPGNGRWLFVGCYKRLGQPKAENGGLLYDLEFLEDYRELAGRLVVYWEKPFRNSYPNGETIASEVEVSEVLAQRMSVSEFKGFKYVRLPFKHLEVIVKEQEPSWRGALSSVAGVYVITDRGANKLYVGSAYGVDGIWGRWSQYTDGHGHNKLLKDLVGAEGIERAEHFCFSILETADIDTDSNEVIARENHWKDVLLTRQAGYNAAEGRRSSSKPLDGIAQVVARPAVR
ncbi:GIY-YIG nuclease family protein [Archangium violaceum]|uniref:GIY-YIG nuclease family protein n=1 Tax=Archangium violaceum TaxID=83451 RepID=UPI000697306A|nr:GIY-YIG nuclease family protein [Archangium violaceum]